MAASSSQTKRFRAWCRRVLWLTACLAGVVVVLVGVGWWLVHASLPRLDGSRVLPGARAAVVIERDASGVPTVSASSRADAARALGYVHAQERFFQMDLLRRRGAGELAALFGSGLVGVDEEARRHGLRRVARAAVEALPSAHREVLQAYTEGVNFGLGDLRVRPPEYLLLRIQPQPWRPEDSLLVAHAMYFDLQDAEGRDEVRRAAARRVLPAEAEAFFFPAGSEWDAALDGSMLPAAPIPGPALLDFRRATAGLEDVGAGGAMGLRGGVRRPADVREWVEALATGGAGRQAVQVEDSWVPGSNSWGVQGAATVSGAAIVCNDMHLGHGMPNIWFRVCLRFPDATTGQPRRVVGASLPGVPVPIVASNGDIAWGFTNGTLDTSDIVLVEVDPADPGRYRTPEGWKAFETVEEVLDVRGEAARTLRFQRTIWGPVVGEERPGTKRAVLWTAHSPEAVNLGLLGVESATRVSEALDLAAGCGIPVQNFLVGDRSGALGYTLIGRLPRRRGFDGVVPVSMADGRARWDGWLTTAEVPRFEAVEGGRLWTANNRILGSSAYLALGALETDPGARARQIRDGLMALRSPVGETDLLALYRDDRAVFLERWQGLMLRVLAGPALGAGDAAAKDWEAMRGAVREWGGRAATNSVGYRLVRAFRHAVHARVLEPVVARCEAVEKGMGFRTDRQEAPVWSVIEARPAHLLNPRFESFDALLADAARSVLEDLTRQKIPLSEATWGARNTLRIRHPLTRAVPQLVEWLNPRPRQVPGDDHMTRVQGAEFGPSERMVVSPGREEAGVFQMPGGQAGHFRSEYYRDGEVHEAWVTVSASPLLPGAARHRLVLEAGRGVAGR